MSRILANVAIYIIYSVAIYRKLCGIQLSSIQISSYTLGHLGHLELLLLLRRLDGLDVLLRR